MVERLQSEETIRVLNQASDELGISTRAIEIKQDGVIVPKIPLLKLGGALVERPQGYLPKGLNGSWEKMVDACAYLVNPFTKFHDLTDDIKDKARIAFLESWRLSAAVTHDGLVLPHQIQFLDGTNITYAMDLPSTRRTFRFTTWFPPAESQLRRQEFNLHPKMLGYKREVTFFIGLTTPGGNTYRHPVSFRE